MDAKQIRANLKAQRVQKFRGRTDKQLGASAKISQTLKGRKFSEETNKKRAAAHVGTKRSEETRAKMSEARKKSKAFTRTDVPTYQGLTLKQWAIQNEYPYHKVLAYYKDKQTLDGFSYTKPQPMLFEGLTIKQWCEKLSVDKTWIHYHLKKHGNLDILKDKHGQ